MKKTLQAFSRHWPALLCIAFLGYIFANAGEKRGDMLITFGLPAIFAIIYIVYLFLGNSDENDKGSNYDLITKLGSYWLKLTLPSKKKPRNGKAEK